MFGDEEARRDLEAIVHPAVYEAIERWFAALPAGWRLAVADIPLLYETGREADFDAVVVTACAPDEQVRRLMARDGAAEDARAANRGAAAARGEGARAPITSSAPTGPREDTNARSMRCWRRCQSETSSSRAVAIRSSTNEFHSWQCGHCHRNSVLR